MGLGLDILRVLLVLAMFACAIAGVWTGTPQWGFTAVFMGLACFIAFMVNAD